MRVRIGAAEDIELLQGLGSPDGRVEDGLVFAPARGLQHWQEVEDELAEAFRLSQEAMVAEAPVVYVVHSRAVLGRSGPLDSAAATGLVGGARALAFEGRRRDRYAVVIGVDGDESAETIAQAVTFTLTTRTAAGQVVMLGKQHLGAMLP